MADKRHEPFRQNCLSVTATFELLKNPPSGSSLEKLKTACVRQELLANFEDADLGIRAMSLGTFKKCADAVIPEGGFSKIDEIRRSLLKPASGAVEESAVPTIAEKLEAAQRIRQVLVEAHLELLRLLKENAPQGSLLRQRIAEHLQKYRGYFGPS